MLLLHLVSTILMNGLIWTIQLVHYPLFERVGTVSFVGYQQEHCRRIIWLVGPWMGIELTTSALIAFHFPGLLSSLGLLILLLIWLLTGVCIAPLHQRLGVRFDASDHRRLLALNGWRTLLWSLRLPVALLLAGFPR